MLIYKVLLVDDEEEVMDRSSVGSVGRSLDLKWSERLRME